MAKKKDKKDDKRISWLDDDDSPLIDDYANSLAHYIDSVTDGKVDDKELKKQEKRVSDHLKKVEKMLDDEQHEAVTELLCEVSAYGAMQILHALSMEMPKTKLKL